MAKFNKVEINISHTHSYGRYKITANYYGKQITTFTNDAECFDYLEDTDNKVKHLEAKKHAYYKIVNEYNNLYKY